MKERPILFSGEMVRAILDGRKTQTRRILKSPFEIHSTARVEDWASSLADLNCYGRQIGSDDIAKKAERLRGKLHPVILTDGRMVAFQCPYGQPGDRLWVRETFAIVPRTAYARSDGVQQTLRPEDPYDHDAAIYREGWTRSRGGFRWRPSIHMPRWASRLTLEITGVRVERLQDISEADAIAEGVTAVSSGGVTLFATTGVNCSAKDAYAALWESINGPGSWDANPWVWAIEFRRVEK